MYQFNVKVIFIENINIISLTLNDTGLLNDENH